jgi:two-component system sensor histidine kinase AlgZ
MLVLAAQLFAIILVLAGSSLLVFDWEKLALVSLFIQWVALSSAFVLCRLRPWLGTLPTQKAVLLSYLVIPLDTWVFAWISQSQLDHDPGFLPPWDESILTQVIIAAILSGLVMRHFYLQAQLIAHSQSELMHRIQALQSRIRPHFLFNSMNIIASLIATAPDTAERVVEDLSELFRASLNEVGNQVPIEQELTLCKRYLHIEQLRLGERLRVQWNIKSLPPVTTIPLLTLQPLLENAIVHGISPMAEGGQIDIDILFHHGLVEIKITNPLPHAGSGHPVAHPETADYQGNRMALDNIRNRLAMLYGQRAKLAAYKEQDCYVTHLSYPCTTSQEGSA